MKWTANYPCLALCKEAPLKASPSYMLSLEVSPALKLTESLHAGHTRSSLSGCAFPAVLDLTERMYPILPGTLFLVLALPQLSAVSLYSAAVCPFHPLFPEADPRSDRVLKQGHEEYFSVDSSKAGYSFAAISRKRWERSSWMYRFSTVSVLMQPAQVAPGNAAGRYCLSAVAACRSPNSRCSPRSSQS